ncbi:MAG TPA: hypothetical protein VE971_03780 [Candidatus Eisenbacteria bacterium]|nr:hypothetical protein [Candidatus Eisenbacteria bacterium]
MKYTKTQLWKIQQAMNMYGGSFVQKLSELLPLADDENQEKLVVAFPEYFEKYLEMSKFLENEK